MGFFQRLALWILYALKFQNRSVRIRTNLTLTGWEEGSVVPFPEIVAKIRDKIPSRPKGPPMEVLKHFQECTRDGKERQWNAKGEEITAAPPPGGEGKKEGTPPGGGNVNQDGVIDLATPGGELDLRGEVGIIGGVQGNQEPPSGEKDKQDEVIIIDDAEEKSKIGKSLEEPYVCDFFRNSAVIETPSGGMDKGALAPSSGKMESHQIVIDEAATTPPGGKPNEQSIEFLPETEATPGGEQNDQRATTATSSGRGGNKEVEERAEERRGTPGVICRKRTRVPEVLKNRDEEPMGSVYLNGSVWLGIPTDEEEKELEREAMEEFKKIAESEEQIAFEASFSQQRSTSTNAEVR